MVKKITSCYWPVRLFWLSLPLLTGCPGVGDFVRPDEISAVSTKGDAVCFSVEEPEDYQSVSITIDPRGTGFRHRKIIFDPALHIVSGQLCVPPSFYRFPDKGQFIISYVLHSKRHEDIPRRMVSGVEIAEGCIFNIPLTDREAVRPYGELENGDAQSARSHRDGPCEHPFNPVHGVKNNESD